jgi:CheY-like chemotaxis protein
LLDRQVQDPMTDRQPRVLLADDNDELRSLLLSRLAGHGYDAVGAGDGVDALAQIARRHHDVLITDIVMPRLDGIGLVERIRANPATAGLPVIVISGWLGESNIDQPLPTRVDALLRKPLRTAELLDLLARLANRPDNAPHGERGILVSTTIQVLQVLEQTGGVEVTSSSGKGILRLVDGEVIGAATGELRGEAAAREILSWSTAEVKIAQDAAWVADEVIRVPLPDLLAASALPRRAPTIAAARPAPAPEPPASIGPGDAGRSESIEPTRSAPPSGRSERHGPPRRAGALAHAERIIALKRATPNQAAVAVPDARASALVDAASGIRGAIVAALIDERTGTTLRETNSDVGDTNPNAGDTAALARVMSRLVGAERSLLSSLGHTEAIESVVVGLSERDLVLQPVAAEQLALLLLVLDKGRTNLALALRGLERIESQIQIDE